MSVLWPIASHRKSVFLSPNPPPTTTMPVGVRACADCMKVCVIVSSGVSRQWASRSLDSSSFFQFSLRVIYLGNEGWSAELGQMESTLFVPFMFQVVMAWMCFISGWNSQCCSSFFAMFVGFGSNSNSATSIIEGRSEWNRAKNYIDFGASNQFWNNINFMSPSEWVSLIGKTLNVGYFNATEAH